MAPNLIRELLLAPQASASLTPADWDLLVRQARAANLLARLGHALADARLLAEAPEAPRRHLESAMRLSSRQQVALRWEVRCLLDALGEPGVPLILLKGAAYSMAGLPAARGRMFTDVDLIVPKAQIGEAEAALLRHGWRAAKMSPYDQRYYRQWMHEIPPLTHQHRGTTVDLHHSILPETARIKVDAAALIASRVPLPEHPGVHVLPPVEMTLHSATHLFHEGEFHNGLRDLFDLDSLLRHFSAASAGFWDRLVPRAAELGLARPLHYALRYTSGLLGTPVPAEVLDAARIGAPPTAVGALMDACYRRALQPVHHSLGGAGTAAARAALYVRSHWLRMPMHLLTYHLGRKAWMRLFDQADEPDADAAAGRRA